MMAIESWSAAEGATGDRVCACPGCNRPTDEWLGDGIWCAACGLDRMLREPDRFAESEPRRPVTTH